MNNDTGNRVVLQRFEQDLLRGFAFNREICNKVMAMIPEQQFKIVYVELNRFGLGIAVNHRRNIACMPEATGSARSIRYSIDRFNNYFFNHVAKPLKL